MPGAVSVAAIVWKVVDPREIHLAPTGLLKRAAEGQQDVAEVSVALKIVLQLEGVTCR